MENDNILEVVMVSDEQTARDGRHFKTIGVIPETSEDEPISTTRMHKRNVWESQPLGGDPNPFYDKIREGAKIRGKIVTMDTVPYYIPNTRGRYVCTGGEYEGERFNRADTKTYVPLEDETAKQLLRNDGLDPDQTPEERRQYGASITDIPVRLLTPEEMEDSPRITDPDEQRRRNFETSKQRDQEREERVKELQEEEGVYTGEESEEADESIT